MIKLLRRLIHAFLYDEDAAQRWVGIGCNYVGGILTNGGTVPGTKLVLPGLEWAYHFGPYIAAAGLAIIAMSGSLKTPPPAEEAKP